MLNYSLLHPQNTLNSLVLQNVTLFLTRITASISNEIIQEQIHISRRLVSFLKNTRIWPCEDTRKRPYDSKNRNCKVSKARTASKPPEERKNGVEGRHLHLNLQSLYLSHSAFSTLVDNPRKLTQAKKEVRFLDCIRNCQY